MQPIGPVESWEWKSGWSPVEASRHTTRRSMYPDYGLAGHDASNTASMSGN
jgi:hypothetical protein